MAKQRSLKIGGVEVNPGRRQTIDLHVARLYTHAEMTLPIHVIHGKSPGPRLFVCAAIHGDEILGIEIVRRLLRMKALDALRGTLIAIPIVNIYGFINQSRFLPDRRDLNRFFPGSQSGSLTSRLAKLFMDEIVSKCTHGIDLHTGSNHRVNLPQIRAYLDDPETERLACAFGVPVVLDADLLEGSLRQAAKDRGIQMLLYEAGEVLRFDEVAIRAGLRGILSVMREIGMLQQRSRRRSHLTPIIARSSTWVRAPISGIFKTRVQLGERVNEGDIVAEMMDPFGEAVEMVQSTATGIVIGKLEMPLAHRGDALLHIARVDDPKAVSEAIIAFKQEFEPEI